ncbi:response regulator transcription factor [Clostridium estertheticum]|uniref:Stage 0 sporulation protein A homolog n=1 Tax=Clostridium estertheticum TaxID=238834 RepID=A0A5N7J4J7_9CLOT|nr:response regulator transcription factor [Clostridium estertheticum]MBU3187820.1 response regulator transcription factor [Clostridium estertheticum]MCB2309288.1 response regulator transcription factor [Clostridium estertheticum]MCB2347669.1 response regulator transcription factor [Clostridium estertheticum]MCB2352202.1 response regulator transcription factor [Clostridium estertheticum]MPQ32954.1 response regulator transcription factor [Clostridium estertheticum]
MPIKILIADDDSLIREGLKIIIGLDEEFIVMGCVENGLEAVEYCLNNQVDVALLDIRMPILNGVEAIKEISLKTKTKCLILTTFDEDEYINAAIRYGAKGYILKNNSPDKIKAAIKVVNSGNMVMQEGIIDKVLKGIDSDNSSKLNKDLFTIREMEIMQAIADGLSNRKISARLFISEGTVKNYITSILNKTSLEHRTQIAIYYLKGGNN